MNQNDRLTPGSNRSLWPGNNRASDSHVSRETGQCDKPAGTNYSQVLDEVWRWILHQKLQHRCEEKNAVRADSPSSLMSVETFCNFPVKTRALWSKPHESRDLLMFSTDWSGCYKQPVRLWCTYRGGLLRTTLLLARRSKSTLRGACRRWKHYSPPFSAPILSTPFFQLPFSRGSVFKFDFTRCSCNAGWQQL